MEYVSAHHVSSEVGRRERTPLLLARVRAAGAQILSDGLCEPLRHHYLGRRAGIQPQSWLFRTWWE